MNNLFAIYGKDIDSALPLVTKFLVTYNKKRTYSFTQNYKSDSCVMGVLTHIDPQTSVQKYDNEASAAMPLLLRTRMAKNALIKCNSGSFQCDNLHEWNRYWQQLSVASPRGKNLKKAISNIQGDFNLMFANEHTQSLVLAVSAFNPHTLFYAQLPDFDNTYVVCSELSVLLGLVPGQVDKLALSMWLAGRPDPNQSMFSNIHQVADASMVTLSVNNKQTHTSQVHTDQALIGISASVEKFWDINPESISDLQIKLAKLKHHEIVDELNNHLQKSVSLNIQSGVEPTTRVFTQLSGGMDSTSVSALSFAALSGSQSTSELHSVSHTYRNTDTCDESDNISAMIARYPFAKSHFIELDKYTDLSFAELYPTHVQSPGMVLSPKYHEEARLLQSFGAKLLLTGNGGDEMFWGHSFAYYDRLKKGDIKVVNEVIKGAKELKLSTWQSLKSVFLRPILHYDILPMLEFASTTDALVERGLHIPSWLTAQSQSMVQAYQLTKAKNNPFNKSKHGLTRYARYEGLFSTSTFNSMRSYQAVFDQYGLTVQHPMFDRNIAEFSFAVDQHLHISGKYPKLLLRQAMSEELPEQVCWNSHKTVFDQHFAKLVKQNQNALRKLLEHEGLQDLDLLDNQALLATFDLMVSSEKPSLNVDLLYAILVQSWYQTHILKLH